MLFQHPSWTGQTAWHVSRYDVQDRRPPVGIAWLVNKRAALSDGLKKDGFFTRPVDIDSRKADMLLLKRGLQDRP